jgi:hypothetical protein
MSHVLSNMMINPNLYPKFAVIAVLIVGPFARLPIDLGAWLLERIARRIWPAETE